VSFVAIETVVYRAARPRPFKAARRWTKAMPVREAWVKRRTVAPK
jgi:hypothetical protein